MKYNIYNFLIKISRIAYERMAANIDGVEDECYYLPVNDIVSVMLSWKNGRLYASMRYTDSNIISNDWIEVEPGEYIGEDEFNSSIETLSIAFGNLAVAVASTGIIIAA